MAKHNETGLKGELLAELFLVKKGYIVLHRNWRHGHKELDLVALKDDFLVIIEIKTRSGTGFGFPEEAVTPAKQQLLEAAAEGYLQAYPHYTKVRFDVVSILLKGDEVMEMRHLEDVFF